MVNPGERAGKPAGAGTAVVNVLECPPYLAGLAGGLKPSGQNESEVPYLLPDSPGMRMEEMRAPFEVCSAPPVPAGSSDGRRLIRSRGRERPIVTDIDRSAAFYRDVLGLSVVTTVPEHAPFVFVWLQRDSIKVFLNAPAGVAEDLPDLARRPVGGTLTMFVTLEAADVASGIDTLFETVQGKAPIVMPLKTQFYGMREFAFEDPDGYVVIVAQRVA